MEIGRLEFYAKKPDVRGKFYGKIYPYNRALRSGIDDGLVFFHESRISHSSSLRTDRRLQGYEYKTRLRDRTIYADPVYVAFDMPKNQTSRRGNAAATVMLLEEANPEELPDLGSIEGASVKVALISAFPSFYTLSRIGKDIVELDQVAQLKACWDGSSGDERIAFIRSLDPEILGKALLYLISIDKRESLSLASPRRTRLALAAKPDAAIIPDVAAKLTPGMWVDEFLAIIGDPSKRDALLSASQPPFRAYALTKFAEESGSLEGNLADDFVAAIRASTGAGITTECLRTVLTVQPRLALRGDISEMLTPALWVDELLDIVQDPAERRILLARAQPTFRAYAIAKLAETEASLDGDASLLFVAAIRECSDEELVTECLKHVLSRQPVLALMGHVAAMLTPDMWVDELLELMRHPENRHAFLAAASPEFRTYAISKFIEVGGTLDENDAENIVAAIRGCEDESFAVTTLQQVLDRQPRLALVGDIIAMLTPSMWTDGFLALMGDRADMQLFLDHAQPSFRVYASARYVEAGGRLDEADVPKFMAAILECQDAKLAANSLAVILARQPRIALAKEVASMLTADMWADELLDLMRIPEEQVALLSLSRPDFRVFAVQKLIEANIDLDIGVLALCPLRSCPALLEQVQWSVDDVSYAKAVGRWLEEARLCDGEGRKLVVSSAERMHATGDLMSPTMWAHLPTTVGVRLCIFWSNHYMNLDQYMVQGGIVNLCLDARRSSWAGYDPTLKAAMLLLSLPFWSDPKEVFLDANDALIGEIVRQFNTCDAKGLRSFTLDCGLQALLQRCGSYQYVDERFVRGFCDGRWWEGGHAVWCHAGMDRPDGGKRKCSSLRSPINAANEKHPSRPDQEDQFMADLLANVNDAMGGSVNIGPWLEPGKSDLRMDLVEYAYRVSGYVNKMAAALPHMVCRGCGSRLTLNYEYPRKSLYRGLDVPALSGTVCSCPNGADTSTQHDMRVYIHYCLNCKRIIDSRECKRVDEEGYYLCMYCGASKVFDAATVCPVCGNTDRKALGYFVGSMRDELDCRSRRKPYGELLIRCKARECGYDAREFRSEFE